jgi:HTH-type transcriptional regulator/antitoxin HipB
MGTKVMKTYSLDQVKDKVVGKKGSVDRDIYEQELTLDTLGEMIKKARIERNLTQEQLGELIGVQKAQISKLERNANNVTLSTILRVFKALKAKINFNVEINKGQRLELT